MPLTWIELVGGSFALSFMGAGLRGIVGLFKAAREADPGSAAGVSLKEKTTSRLSVAAEIFKWRYFIGTALVGGAAGTVLALVQGYTFGVGIVADHGLTTLGLLSAGWVGIDFLEALFKRS